MLIAKQINEKVLTDILMSFGIDSTVMERIVTKQNANATVCCHPQKLLTFFEKSIGTYPLINQLMEYDKEMDKLTELQSVHSQSLHCTQSSTKTVFPHFIESHQIMTDKCTLYNHYLELCTVEKEYYSNKLVNTQNRISINNNQLAEYKSDYKRLAKILQKSKKIENAMKQESKKWQEKYSHEILRPIANAEKSIHHFSNEISRTQSEIKKFKAKINRYNSNVSKLRISLLLLTL